MPLPVEVMERAEGWGEYVSCVCLALACWERDDVCGRRLRGDGTNEEASEHGYFAVVGLEEFEHRAGLCQGGRRWVEAELDC